MILDDIRVDLDPERLKTFDTILKDVTIVRATNVADYYYENSKDYWDLNDFPNVAPPWPNIWIEYNMPSNWLTDNPEKIPEYLKRVEVQKGLWRVYTPFRDYCGIHLLYEDANWLKQIDCRWMVHCSFYRGSIPGKYLVTQTFCINADGTIKKIRASDTLAKELILSNLGLPDNDSGKGEFLVPSLYSDFAWEAKVAGLDVVTLSAWDVAFLTISFCHCKNVVAKKEMLDERLKKKRQVHNKYPISKTYTLNIMPIKQLLQGKRGEHGSMQQALHIVRGQFRDYTEGSGLFGKWHGVYFFPQHARGSLLKGQIKKDYQVKL
jgi:hypothetical protein